jgi:hypothetical protein
VRRAGPLAAALLVASAIGAGPASADVISFDHGAAKVGHSSDLIPIVTPSDPLELNNVSYGPGSSFATTSPDDFGFTPYSGTFNGVAITLDLAPDAPVTGTFDPATGTMATDPVPFTVTVVAGPPNNATCTYTNPLSFSTDNSKVILGDRFDLGGPPFVNGAVATTWSGVPGDPDPGCGLVINDYASQPGGFWLADGLATPRVLPHPFACAVPTARAPAVGDCSGGYCPGLCTHRCAKGRVLKKGRCVKKKGKRKKRRKRGRRR